MYITPSPTKDGLKADLTIFTNKTEFLSKDVRYKVSLSENSINSSKVI